MSQPTTDHAAPIAQAMALMRMGDYAQAIALLQAAIRARPGFFEALLVLAQAQEATGDLAGAENSYRQALQRDPHSPAALCGFGELLGKTNRPKESEHVLRSAMEGKSLTPSQVSRIAHGLGIALAMQGQDEEAITAFRRALADNPTNIAAHQELNATLYRLGHDREFLESYDTAIRRLPPGTESGGLLMQKGSFLLRAERFEEARECFARVADMAPRSAGPQNALAQAVAGLGALDASIAAYEKSMALRPDDLTTRINLACTLLEFGDTKRALHLTDQVMPQMPFDQSVLAVHELALRANDDPRAAGISDYERHVQIFDLEPPPGFSSMADFNAALNAHLDCLHTDLREHIDQTLRHGTQTATSLLGGDNPLIAALRHRIEEAVNAYIARLEECDGPLAARRRAGFSFSGSWSSRLRDCGFHTNHIHPNGWISSCYYVAVPDAVADETARQGWIKFGEPSFKTLLRDPVRRAVQPMPGRLVLFPSYMWHGTIPFRSATARTTIAFDAVPA